MASDQQTAQPSGGDNQSNSTQQESRPRRSKYADQLPPLLSKGYVVQGENVSHIYMPSNLERAMVDCGEQTLAYNECLRMQRRNALNTSCNKEVLAYLECMSQSKYRQPVEERDWRNWLLPREQYYTYRDQLLWYFDDQWKEFKRWLKW